MTKHWVDYVAAFSTSGAALAAAAAAFYTSNQADIARDSAERQLRAYVNVVSRSEQLANFEDPNNPRAELALNNTGETPAYNVEISTGCRIFAINALEIDFPLMKADDNRLIIPGHSMGSQYLNVYCERIIDQQKIDFLKRKNKMIFWGTAFYTDAFKKAHYTQFCYRVTKKEGKVNNVWSPCEAHQLSD